MATQSKTLILLALLAAQHQAEAVIDEIETAIQRAVPEATRIFVELEPGR